MAALSEQTAISWTDATFNPWIGCTKVSPGCDSCYAWRREDQRLHRVKWGAGQPRQRTKTWGDPVRWNKQPFCECTACGWRGEQREAPIVDAPGESMPRCPVCDRSALKEARRRVFCASLADWLDNEVPIEWLVDLLDLIRKTPQLDWLLLSKRIGNWRKRLEEARAAAINHAPTLKDLYAWIDDWLDGAEAPANVVLMATVVNQAEVDRDVAKLLATPARRRGLSIEPMLGPIRLQRWLWECCGDMQPGNDHGLLGQEPDHCCGRPDPRDALHWVIAGGESGQHARPAHPDWFRSLREQCAAAGVPFHFKQWGEWASVSEVEGPGRHFSFPDGATVRRVGTKAAGRMLGGIEHNGFPA